MKNKKESKGKRRTKHDKEINKRKLNKPKGKGNNNIRNNRKHKVYQENQTKHKIIKNQEVHIKKENSNVGIKHKVRRNNNTK